MFYKRFESLPWCSYKPLAKIRELSYSRLVFQQCPTYFPKKDRGTVSSLVYLLLSHLPLFQLHLLEHTLEIAVLTGRSSTGYSPYPFDTQINNPEDHDLILTVTDDGLSWEQFTVTLDGQVLGKTTAVTPNWYADCGENADDCITRGWSHGYFKIPPGTQSQFDQQQ